jgi:hypothetical protein
MIVTSKYDIGHTFWVPRCVPEYTTEVMHFEGEEWNREVTTYVGYAKQKRVVKINASTFSTNGITRGVGAAPSVHIQYYVINTEDPDGMAQVYSEDDINDYTEEEALNIAKEFEKLEEHYYGN